MDLVGQEVGGGRTKGLDVEGQEVGRGRTKGLDMVDVVGQGCSTREVGHGTPRSDMVWQWLGHWSDKEEVGQGRKMGWT